MRKMRFGVYRKHSLSRSQIGFSKVAQTRLENRVTRPNEVWYGIVGFNVPIDTL